MRERLLAAALLLAGCASPPQAVPAQEPAAKPPLPFASEFVEGQRARVQHLADFASRGSAELRWNDEQGAHFEQAQIELAWRERGARMALRADKLGERLAWAGADAERWWIFEPKAEPSRLTVGPRGTVPSGSMLPFVGPESVMELLAVRPWPASAEVRRADGSGAVVQWKIERPIGAWSRTRAFIERPGAMPLRMELLDSTGAVLASSELSRPLPVRIDSLPTGAWPEVGGTVRLRMSGDSGATWDVFWDAPGVEPARLNERLFDLSVLKGVMRPQREIDAAADARP